jgi:hypothetical protein
VNAKSALAVELVVKRILLKQLALGIKILQPMYLLTCLPPLTSWLVPLHMPAKNKKRGKILPNLPACMEYVWACFYPLSSLE